MSPLLPQSCRFFPSCSVYAAAAFERYGLAQGAALALKRLGRCHPWNPGGFDPLA
ncbi:MAG TPA: membrane protein insertion efficiency factor YidD [Candidatus Eisenbacteria bacterium]|nr:membrane protein insertion efficiency factor YidD [Candidatus Eisenbacteria bacterium]